MNIALVVAAGKGTRFGGDTPKQFVEVRRKPLLAWSLEAFQNSSLIDGIVVVTAEEQIERCKEEVTEPYGITKLLDIVAGGTERCDSVYAGLCAIDRYRSRETGAAGENGASREDGEKQKHVEPCYCLIHDGARPWITEELIRRGLEAAKDTGAAIPGLPATETVKRVDENGIVTDTPPRPFLRLIQTPQIFLLNELLAAYEDARADGAFGASLTDDALVMERYGTLPVRIYEGDPANRKITSPEDL